MNKYFRIIALTLALLALSACAVKSANLKTAAGSSQKSSSGAVKKNGPLAGLTVCIDPGHGKSPKSSSQTEPIAPGSDIRKAALASGTVGIYTGITEESLNLAVSKRLQKALLENGAKVIMVRESSSCDLTNVERAKFWNATDADLTIRIHGNGINDSAVSGILMMVPGNKYIKDTEILRKSRKVGEFILKGVLEQTKAKSRGLVETSELTGFNWSEIPVVLLEVGFMTNPQEDRLLNTEEYQDKIVAGITEGLLKYERSIKN
jgi:N-acetylmuramoyl-L-alanine amidase